MNLQKAYRIAAIYPALFVIVISFVYAVFENNNYKSEWLTGDSMRLISILISFVYSLVMCLLSLTIFLNNIVKWSSILIWNLLTWFLLPLGFVIIIIAHDINYRLTYNAAFGRDFIYILVIITPFVIGLCWSFINYRRIIH